MTPLTKTTSPLPTLPRPKAVLFDWDGTLVNTVPLIQQAINHILAQFDHPPAAFGSGLMASVAGSSGLFKTLLGEEEGTKAKNMYEAHLDAQYNDPAGPCGKHLAFDGAAELLQLLKNSGVPTSIVTNKRRYRFQLEAEATGLIHYLTDSVTLNEVVERKPHPEMVQTATARLSLPVTSAIWVVGDHRVDSESAKQAGASSVHLEHNYAISETHPPDLIIADLRALHGMLEDLLRA